MVNYYIILLYINIYQKCIEQMYNKTKNFLIFLLII